MGVGICGDGEGGGLLDWLLGWVVDRSCQLITSRVEAIIMTECILGFTKYKIW